MIVPAVIFVKNEQSRSISRLRRMRRDLPLGQLIVKIVGQQERITPSSQHA
jgi:HAMP domain-containing protein